jgi:hypothetical protein
MERCTGRLIVSFVVIPLCVLAATSVRGADVLSRHLASDVTAAASLDLEKFNILTAYEYVVDLGIVPAGDVASGRRKAAEAQEAYAMLPKLGARRAYVLLRPSDFEFGGTSLVIELKEGSDADAVAKLVTSWLEVAREQRTFGRETEFLPHVVKAVDGAVLAASNAEQMKLLAEARPAGPRADAAAALAALEAADAGIVAFGDADSRRVVREMFPQMPAPFLEIDGRLLADGVAWTGITFRLPPEPTFSVTVDALTSEAATTLSGSLEKALTMLKGLCMVAATQGRPEAVAALPLLAQLKSQTDGLRLSVTFGDNPEEIAALRNVLAPALGAAQESARRSQRLSNFKQIALGMLSYESAKGSYPPPAIYSADGKPLLSWRVAILPYLEQQELYNQFHLDEPWDSAHNRTLLAKIPPFYVDPSLTTLARDGRTTFVVPRGEGLLFSGPEGTKIREVRDGTSTTILVTEVIPELAVPWTKPSDWDVDLSDPLRGVKRGSTAPDGGAIAAAFCDGSVRMIRSDVDPDEFKGALTIAGQEPPAGF